MNGKCQTPQPHRRCGAFSGKASGEILSDRLLQNKRPCPGCPGKYCLSAHILIYFAFIFVSFFVPNLDYDFVCHLIVTLNFWGADALGGYLFIFIMVFLSFLLPLPHWLNFEYLFDPFCFFMFRSCFRHVFMF